jgi:hypothetical protein
LVIRNKYYKRKHCRACACKLKGNGKREKHGLTVKCKICAKTFYRYPSETKVFCSFACKGIAARKSQRYIAVCKNCGKQFKAVEKPRSNNSNNYCSMECRNEAYQKQIGALNHNWQGGLKYKNRISRGRRDYKKWRKAVLVRDNYTCQKCGVKAEAGNGVYLHAHHIVSFTKYESKRTDISNGETLCALCHGRIHGINYERLEHGNQNHPGQQDQSCAV